MTEVVLHIGTGKTGTSAVQRAFAAARPVLASQGVGYPRFGDHDHQSYVAMLFMDPQWARVSEPKLRTDDGRAALTADVTDVLSQASANSSRVLLSSEYFASLVTDGAVAECRDFLSQWFDSITVVGYFRRQDYAIASLYSESFRTWPIRGFAAHGSHVTADRRIDATHSRRFADSLDYRRILQAWSDELGDDRVHACPYLERYKSTPTWVVGDLCSYLNVDPAAILAELAMGDANASLSADAVAVIRRLAPAILMIVDTGSTDEVPEFERDCLAPFCRVENDRVVFDRNRFNDTIARTLPGDPLRVSGDFAAELLVDYAESNEWLAATGTSSDEWSAWFKQPPPPTGPIQLPMVSDERLAKVAQAWRPRWTDRLAGRIRRAGKSR